MDDKEKEYSQLKQNMLYYKMQLLNREKVYNEIFNANPNVGVLNPLEGKNKK